jgi:hypothetical protein
VSSDQFGAIAPGSVVSIIIIVVASITAVIVSIIIVIVAVTVVPISIPVLLSGFLEAVEQILNGCDDQLSSFSPDPRVSAFAGFVDDTDEPFQRPFDVPSLHSSFNGFQTLLDCL